MWSVLGIGEAAVCCIVCDFCLYLFMFVDIGIFIRDVCVDVDGVPIQRMGTALFCNPCSTLHPMVRCVRPTLVIDTVYRFPTEPLAPPSPLPSGS